MPNEMLPSLIVAPSLAAHVIMENVGKGLPLFRIEDSFRRDGLAIDRATLSRMKKLVGDTLMGTVVKAMSEHALATAFCISTDATGVNVQPIYSHEKGSQPAVERPTRYRRRLAVAGQSWPIRLTTEARHWPRTPAYENRLGRSCAR